MLRRKGRDMNMYRTLRPCFPSCWCDSYLLFYLKCLQTNHVAFIRTELIKCQKDLRDVHNPISPEPSTPFATAHSIFFFIFFFFLFFNCWPQLKVRWVMTDGNAPRICRLVYCWRSWWTHSVRRKENSPNSTRFAPILPALHSNYITSAMIIYHHKRPSPPQTCFISVPYI